MDDGKIHMDFFRFLFIISIYDVFVVVAQQKRGFLGAETSSSSLGFSQEGGREVKTIFKEQRGDDGRIHMEILALSSSSVYIMFLLL